MSSLALFGLIVGAVGGVLYLAWRADQRDALREAEWQLERRMRARSINELIDTSPLVVVSPHGTDIPVAGDWTPDDICATLAEIDAL